jgi:hypothetical protein
MKSTELTRNSPTRPKLKPLDYAKLGVTVSVNDVPPPPFSSPASLNTTARSSRDNDEKLVSTISTAFTPHSPASKPTAVDTPSSDPSPSTAASPLLPPSPPPSQPAPAASNGVSFDNIELIGTLHSNAVEPVEEDKSGSSGDSDIVDSSVAVLLSHTPVLTVLPS